jgi:predicted nucleotidyltransferase component of viral defense system
MSVSHPINLPASVKQRLLNISRQKSIEFNVLLTKYALERLLYRMSVSRYRNRFVLKGALLFWAWEEDFHRTTRDVDFLDLGSPSLQRLSSDFQRISAIKTKPDGLHFLPESVRAEEIRGRATFRGIRISLTGMLGKAKVPLQIDIGYGDVLVPSAKLIRFPVLLNFPAPRLRASARETLIAEKFHAAVDLGMRNSRMKDYFDIYYLSQKYDFRGKDLSRAIIATFQRQKTEIPSSVPLGLSPEFCSNPAKMIQWKSFYAHANIALAEMNFDEVVATVREFIMPAASAAAKGKSFNNFWPVGGPWQPQEKDHDG